MQKLQIVESNEPGKQTDEQSVDPTQWTCPYCISDAPTMHIMYMPKHVLRFHRHRRVLVVRLLRLRLC